MVNCKGRNKKENATKTTMVVMLVTFGAKAIGYVRELVLAGIYGTSYVVDAYIMSQSIPYMILGAVIGAVATIYIPLLSEKVEKKSEEEGNLFTKQMLNMLFFILFIVSILGIVFSEQLTHILASGFSGETAKLTSFFLKISFGYTVFWGGSRILDAYLQYKGIFVPQIVYGYIQNIVIIGTIVASSYYQEYFLVMGFLIGHVVNYLLVLFTAKKHGYQKVVGNAFPSRELFNEIGKLALPVFIGSEVNVLNAFVDKWLGSRLGEGVVSSLSYAYEIQVLILSFTATIYVTVLYPQLARNANSNDTEAFNIIIQKGIRVVTALVVPCMLGAILFSEPIVRFIYERGAFDASATRVTSSVFAFYSLGIFSLALCTLFTRVFYALKDMKTPVKYGTISVIFNIVCNLILVNIMQYNGLALSTSMAAVMNAIMLYRALRKKYPWIVIFSEPIKLVVTICMAILSVGISYILFSTIISLKIVSDWICLFAAIVTCALIYLMLLIVCGVDEAKNIVSTICSWMRKISVSKKD